MAQKQYTGPLIPRIRSADGFSHVSGESQNMMYHEGRKMAAHVLDEMEQLGTSWASRQYETTDGIVIRTHASQAPGQQPMVYIEAVVQPGVGGAQQFDSFSPPEPVVEPLPSSFVPPLFKAGDYVIEPNPDVPLDGEVVAEAGGWRIAHASEYIPYAWGTICTTDGTDDPRFVFTGASEAGALGYGGLLVDGDYVSPGSPGFTMFIAGKAVSFPGDATGYSFSPTGEYEIKGSMSTELLGAQVSGSTGEFVPVETIENEYDERHEYWYDVHDDWPGCSYGPCTGGGGGGTATYELPCERCGTTVVTGGGTRRREGYECWSRHGQKTTIPEQRYFVNWGSEPRTQLVYTGYERERGTDDDKSASDISTTTTIEGAYGICGSTPDVCVYIGYYSAHHGPQTREYNTRRWADYSEGFATIGDHEFPHYEGRFLRDVVFRTIEKDAFDELDGHYVGGHFVQVASTSPHIEIEPLCPFRAVSDLTETRDVIMPPEIHDYSVHTSLDFFSARLQAFTRATYTYSHSRIPSQEAEFQELYEAYVNDELVYSSTLESANGAALTPVTADGCGIVRVNDEIYGVYNRTLTELPEIFGSADGGVGRGMAGTPAGGFPRVEIGQQPLLGTNHDY